MPTKARVAFAMMVLGGILLSMHDFRFGIAYVAGIVGLYWVLMESDKDE